MPKKKAPAEDWINGETAATLLSEQSGHAVSSDYVRRLGNKNLLTTKAIDKRTKVYLRSDVENYKVKPRGDGSVRRAVRGEKG